MKICIPAIDDRGLDAAISAHFGRAPYLVVAGIDGGDVTVVRNPQCHEHHGDCHHVPILRAHDVGVVVCGGLGRQALAGLAGAGIVALTATGRTVAEALDAVRAGTARPATSRDGCGCDDRTGRPGSATAPR